MPISRSVVWRVFLLIGITCVSIIAAPVLASNVILSTPLGNVEIELYDEMKPGTVTNFLNYVNDGSYENTFVHRSVPGFVIQGGGYTFIDAKVDQITSDPPIKNEPGISNLRGTIAMAKLGGDPDSATSQWYINLKDNSEDLDDANGGYTVFGQVVGDGMDVIDAIADLQVWNAGSPFDQLPLIDFPGNVDISEEHLVMTDINEVAPVNEFPIDAGLNGNWWNGPDRSGEGVQIEISDGGDGSLVFVATIYSYDLMGNQIFLIAVGTVNGSTVEVDVFITDGGFWGAEFDPAVVNETPWGSGTFEAFNCESMLMELIPNAQFQGMGYTILRYALIRLTTSLIPCPS